MAASLDSYLRSLASSYYLKNNSTELSKIETSLNTLFKNLDSSLGYRIKRRFVFGSYERDTILPRRYDIDSDVDIMIVFNHTDHERTPETYRNWLKKFADDNYKNRYGSDVVKSFPTITIKLDNIKYDLVPAKEEESWYNSTLYIPDSSGWIVTDPHDVKEKLRTANTSYNSIVRPIIRIMKAWNCHNSTPFDSYELELKLIDMNYSGDNVQSGFFYAARQLDTSWSYSQIKNSKIERLQSIIDSVENELSRENTLFAKSQLHKLLPYP